MYDLSILIPARSEMFLKNTVEDILKNKRGKTEIIVVLDGAWADPGIPDHVDVTTIYNKEALGQRAATNQAARMSKAKYLMKVDAHCAFDEGFDLKLMADMQDTYTMVPVMHNLHVFDWVCENGHRRYQGPSGVCKECSKETKRDIVWFAKPSPKSTSYRFDKTLHFQYWGEYKKVQEEMGSQLVETMSLQGSCFMMTRTKYWELNICDEEWGSWGQQGTEVAGKTWLSGGRVVVNKNTWYGHCFRTQGGDFGFPYPQSGRQIEHARKRSREILQGNKYPQAIHSFDWLVKKFEPPEWEDIWKKIEHKSEKGIIYFTDNQLKLKIAHRVQKQLNSIGLPIVSSSLKPMTHFGTNVHLPLQRGVITYFKQIIAALNASSSEFVFFCEHDVLYHPSHFEFTPTRHDTFYYNQNFWKVRDDGFAVHWDANQVSGLCVDREYALGYYKNRLIEIEKNGFNRSYEPGGRNNKNYEVWKSEYPNIDIRHKGTLTGNKWSPKDFRDKSTCVNWQESTISAIPGWDEKSLVFI